MDTTVIKMVGSLAGIHYGVSCFASDCNISTDDVIIRDLTIDCNWEDLSVTADTGAGGEKNVATGAITLWGSNNLIERVRAINGYGSWANLQEQFLFYLCGPRSADATNNIIQFCRAELPQGNYGSPFALMGWANTIPSHVINSSKVISCTAIGTNNGLATGFTSGGVNLVNVKGCQIDGNTFIDCYGAAYIDTGSCDGLSVTNNTVTRGWMGVGLYSPTLPKQNIEISGNTFSIQNRVIGGASYGVFVGQGVTSNLTVANNTITFESTGSGLQQFWGVQGSSLNSATIFDNKVGLAPCGVANLAAGIDVAFSNNTLPDGSLVPGL